MVYVVSSFFLVDSSTFSKEFAWGLFEDKDILISFELSCL